LSSTAAVERLSEAARDMVCLPAQRLAMAGVAQVNCTDAKGAEKEARMQNCGGRWKLVPD
jgi:hypothetical protein